MLIKKGFAFFLIAFLLPIVLPGTAHAQAVIDLKNAQLVIDETGRAHIEGLPGETAWPTPADPFIKIQTATGVKFPQSISFENQRLTVGFPDGASCVFTVEPHDGFAIFSLESITGCDDIQRLDLFSLGVAKDAEVLDTLNAAQTAQNIVAVSSAEVNVHAFVQSLRRDDADRAGCSHEFASTTNAKEGTTAAQFDATCDETPSGWSCTGHILAKPVDLTGLKAISAWVYGDGKGELLKIQPHDRNGGSRDTYIPIDFQGWRQVTVSDSPYDHLDPSLITGISIYYNGMPASEKVSCLIDQIEAVVERNGVESRILLENFEPGQSLFWTQSTATLNLETLARHGIQPARFGVLASPRERFMEVMEAFEAASGLPSPHPGGVWNKRSPWVKDSYLFITQFSEDQYDDVVAMARRGGFKTILILQDSWTRATGHYAINTDRFPGGLEALARTVQRFKADGFRVGFHTLGASIYPPDSYLTPVPDARLVKDAKAELAEDIDASATVIPTAAAPEGFPSEDGGYMGAGMVFQIDNELIVYGAASASAPWAFSKCQRGFLDTAPAPHAKGATIHHLKRSYGYFMFDMDTTLIDEVSSHFAEAANACDIDMIYFDGSEALQGDHWYYNARLHKAFFDKMNRKDLLMQASSFSHYSWHILARSASADGHDDLKAYLDERSGCFDYFKNNIMPLDIGWYYGYDPSATPDMFEYILGATIGYDSSMSFQVSLEAAAQHPFIGTILDLIARYERLRLSGRVPREMRDRLRIDPSLRGEMTAEQRAELLEVRQEYRLVGAEGQESFQRVLYPAWHEVHPEDTATAKWTTAITTGPATLGVQVTLDSGPWMLPGPAYVSDKAVTLESFDDLAPYRSEPGSGVMAVQQGEGGSTLDGVTQSLVAQDQDVRAGGHCALFTAASTRKGPDGWAYFGKSFNPPLDLSWHKALGFWLRGDGQGGAFKVQLTGNGKAADFYITNDYTGWRYHQLPRPSTDPMDYSRVETLGLYYNGLPGETKVACAIDDIKALPALDTAQIIDPWFEIDGQRIEWKGTLNTGEYVFLWDNEPWQRYRVGLSTPETGPAPAALPVLDKGEHAIQFGAQQLPPNTVRARVVIQPPECHKLP